MYIKNLLLVYLLYAAIMNPITISDIYSNPPNLDSKSVTL